MLPALRSCCRSTRRVPKHSSQGRWVPRPSSRVLSSMFPRPTKLSSTPPPCVLEMYDLARFCYSLAFRILQVQVGSEGQTCMTLTTRTCVRLYWIANVLLAVNLLIDTGSSNTWVGSQTLTNPFVGSGTTQRTGDLVVCSPKRRTGRGALVDRISSGSDLRLGFRDR